VTAARGESGPVLAIDLGTSTTVAVLRHADGRTDPVLVDGLPLMPSAVYCDPQQGLLTGQDAVRSARRDPSRFEPNPKRRIDDGVALLGRDEVPVVDLLAALLNRVAGEARRTLGADTDQVVLTHPAGWGSVRRATLTAAAERAGLDRPALVAEPVSAAVHFTNVVAKAVPEGAALAVYDLGAGTFDVSVVVAERGGFRPVGDGGVPDCGGLDIDAALVEHVGAWARQGCPEAWERLVAPRTAEDRRARRLLWDDIRGAKEMLSRSAVAHIHVPLGRAGAGADEVHLTRQELEDLAEPLLARTVSATTAVLHEAGVGEPRRPLAGVFLVGGASRMPLVARLLHRRLGIAPTVVEQPELAVVTGAVGALAPPTPAGSSAAPPPPAEPLTELPPAAGRRRRWLPAAVIAGALAAVVGAAGAAFATGLVPGGDPPYETAPAYTKEELRAYIATRHEFFTDVSGDVTGGESSARTEVNAQLRSIKPERIDAAVDECVYLSQDAGGVSGSALEPYADAVSDGVTSEIGCTLSGADSGVVFLARHHTKPEARQTTVAYERAAGDTESLTADGEFHRVDVSVTEGRKQFGVSHYYSSDSAYTLDLVYANG
jgi:actin-like ATPase involved in cell morphogenesis